MSLIDGLSGWLKQIIAVVLLASLVDLLLPNRTMQRYVRLVAGLFVLITVATPMLKWIQSDFGGKLSAELDAAIRTPPAARDEFLRIESEGRKLRDRKNAQAADLTASRLAETIRADVEQSEKRKVLSVDVKMEMSPQGGLSVKDVAVTLEAPGGTDHGASGASRGRKPIAKVEPVTPVTVDVSDSRQTETSGFDSETVAAAVTEPDRPAQLRISAYIAAHYGIPADRIVVKETVPDGA